jgi:predicted MPP superfamily phosphohydrolase
LQAFWLEPASLTVANSRIAIASMKGQLRVAVLTDLHVGSPHNGIDNLSRVVELTNAQRPDLVCLLGDLVIQGVRGGTFVPPEDIAAALKGLRSTHGTVAVLGNHDSWLDHDRVAAALTMNGIRVIEETAVPLDTAAGRLWVAGISDLWEGRHDVEAALAAVTNDREPVLLLTHNPDIFPTVPTRVSLTLAGHTHGGQVRLPFIGRPIVPSRFGQRYAAGLVVEGGRQMFVSTGIGTSIIPVRFRVPPSVTVLTISPVD